MTAAPVVPFGPALDALVAECVMGWRAHRFVPAQTVDGSKPALRCHWFAPGQDIMSPLPSFSTDIAAAWQVVEHMRGLGYALTLLVGLQGSATAHFGCLPPLAGESILCDTAAEAICRAALAAVEAKENAHG